MNHSGQCKVCNYGPDSIDWSLSNVAISEIVDCSKDSVRRHKLWAEANGINPEDELTVTNDPNDVPGNWIPRRKWQTPSGEVLYSYQNVTDTTPEDLTLDNERIDSLIRDWPTHLQGDYTGGTELALPADLQLGKSEGGVGTDETIAKFYASIEKVAERWYNLRPAEGYLCDLGDLIENIYSTPGQVSTNDRMLPNQIEDAVAVYMNAIGRLLPLTGKLYHATVTSNHGEARSAAKTNPYDSENDWGLMIQRLIQDRCKDRGWDVTFIRPDKYEDTATFTTQDGTRVALTHGHHSGSPARMKEWIKNQIVGKRPGWDADQWYFGHYHHVQYFPIGNGIDVFGTPSLDPGSAWFTKKTGESSPQGIVAVTVDGGSWSNFSVL